MRQLGMGAVGSIPLDKIAWYAERLDLDIIEAEVFEDIIRAVDVAYLNRKAERARKSK